MKYFLSVIQLLSIFIRSSLQDGFIKDLNTNSQFPPILERRDGIPMGHLRPLGWQNRPEDIVREDSVKLEPVDFWKNYIMKDKPVVIRGLVNGAEAIDKWSDVYLSRKYSDIDIYVKSKKQKIKEINRKMKFKEFLQGYRSEDWYLRVILPLDMQKETPMPNLINCGPYTDGLDVDVKSKVVQLIEPNLWMSAGETSSLLHLHSKHSFHCVLDGRKDFILISTEQLKKKNNKEWTKLLNLQETYMNSDEFVSRIDVDMVNVYEYKILNEIKWYWSTLKTGDCIFIPSSFLHQVRSFGRSVSETIDFNVLKTMHLNRINNTNYENELFKKCEKNAPLFGQMHLSSNHFLFTYTHGDKHLVKKNIKTVDAKYVLLYLLQNNSNLYFKKFNHFFEEIATELSEKMKFDLSTESLNIWNNFDKLNQMYLTYDNIMSLDENDLKAFVRILKAASNLHHGEGKGEL